MDDPLKFIRAYIREKNFTEVEREEMRQRKKLNNAKQVERRRRIKELEEARRINQKAYMVKYMTRPEIRKKRNDYQNKRLARLRKDPVAYAAYKKHVRELREKRLARQKGK
jgi:hypothetical protein